MRNRCTKHNDHVFCSQLYDHAGECTFPEPGTMIVYQYRSLGKIEQLDKEYAELVWKDWKLSL